MTTHKVINWPWKVFSFLCVPVKDSHLSQNSNLDTKIPANTEANKISPKQLEEQERKKNLDNY